jgi:hypothetical protein
MAGNGIMIIVELCVAIIAKAGLFNALLAVGSYVYFIVYWYSLLRVARKDHFYTPMDIADTHLGFIRRDRRLTSIIWYERLCRMEIGAILWFPSALVFGIFGFICIFNVIGGSR